MTHLLFNLTQFSDDPTSSRGWIKDHPSTLLSVYTMNPSNPQRLKHTAQMPNNLPNRNPIP